MITQERGARQAGLLTSALPPKADIAEGCIECFLTTKRGHSDAVRWHQVMAGDPLNNIEDSVL